MKKVDPKTTLLEHSKAKVRLYGKYLSAYLSILSQVHSVKKIFLFDLLCGEGRYENGAKGSPLIALDILKRLYSENSNTRLNMEIWFNDLEDSKIEQGISKVNRVRKISKEYSLPPQIALNFYQKNYSEILPQAIKEVENGENSKGLFFIDPYGYKVVKPIDIKNILACGNTELLLFLPVAYMYRFVVLATQSDENSVEPLKDFLIELFGSNIPKFASVYVFIDELKKHFRDYLSDHKVYVDTFTIERDSSNVYCLFFFTSSQKGYEVMLQTKWQVDPARGKGFIQEKTLSFLNEVTISGYSQKLEEFILSNNYRSNQEVFEFGLKNGFLPKHSNEIIQTLRERYIGFEIFSLDEKAIRGSYSYIGNDDRKVGIRINQTLI